MMKPAELTVHRKGTDHFIDCDETIITLKTRSSPIITDGTKSFTPDVERPAQSFKVIWMGDNGIVREPSPDGGVRRFDFVLVGRYDAVAEIGDYWKVGNQEYRLEYRFADNGYEIKLGGSSHGSRPDG